MNDDKECIANIGPRERAKRMRFGILFFLISIALAGYLVASGASRWWRLVLLVPFAMGAVGFFQAREKT